VWVVNATPRPVYPREETRYPFYRRQDGPQGRSGQLRKISPPPGFLSLFTLFVLQCPDFPGFLLFILIVKHTTQTSMPSSAIPASDRPQTLALDRLATGIGVRSQDRPTHSQSLYRLSYPCPQVSLNIYWMGGCVGNRASIFAMEKGKNLCPCLESIPVYRSCSTFCRLLH
jgi:hypothetical protein